MGESMADRFRIAEGDTVKLGKIDPGETLGWDQTGAAAALSKAVDRLDSLQERLFAEHRQAVLLVLQGMDTAGKDGVIKHVMSRLNPMGCKVVAFKAPTEEEADHGYLWRTQCVQPGYGEIGVFNRSYYEEVLAGRVREKRADPDWPERFREIVGHERYLANNRIKPIKFFLHISRDEQRKRLLARADDPAKHWKFQVGDVADRALWKQYAAAYEEAIAATSTKKAPWFVIPSDHKWFARLAVANILLETLEKLDPRFPETSKAQQMEIGKARQQLLEEKD